MSATTRATTPNDSQTLQRSKRNGANAAQSRTHKSCGRALAVIGAKLTSTSWRPVLETKFVTPWLIQRWKVNSKWKPSLKVSEYLKQDYMGSAEFEFGAIPKALREFHARLGRLVYTKLEVNGNAVHLLSLPEHVEPYKAFLAEMAKDKYAVRLKERVRLAHILSNCKDQTYMDDDLWWDLDNVVAIALEKGPLMNLKDALVNSVKFMDEQKAKEVQ